MSREIKFRAWDKARHQMFEVTQLEWSAYTTQAFSSLELLSMDGNYTAQHIDGLTTIIRDIYEIMQFTGLKDKNGKEVYEGDIIAATLSDEGQLRPVREAVTWNEEYANYEPFNNLCNFDEDRWINNFWDDAQGRYDSHCFEVIGNIYEHPQLLEVQA